MAVLYWRIVSLLAGNVAPRQYINLRSARPGCRYLNEAERRSQAHYGSNVMTRCIT